MQLAPLPGCQRRKEPRLFFLSTIRVIRGGPRDRPPFGTGIAPNYVFTNFVNIAIPGVFTNLQDGSHGRER